MFAYWQLMVFGLKINKFFYLLDQTKYFQSGILSSFVINIQFLGGTEYP